METIKENYFKEMSGDVFLSSAFAQAITPSRPVFGEFMLSGAAAEVCHASALVPAVRDVVCWGCIRKGLFSQNLSQGHRAGRGRTGLLSYLCVPVKNAPQDPRGRGRGPGYPVTHNRASPAHGRLLMHCKADSDCCSRLPPTYSSSWDRAARLLRLEKIPKGLW